MAPNQNSGAPSIEEIIATLQRSSLPTVVIEGKHDVIVWRHLEEVFAAEGISILPVGGRPNVLAIFNRRAEIDGNTVVAFIADRDTWVCAGVPEAYRSEKLLLSDGYSVENDIFRDGDLEQLMSAAEKKSFLQETDKFLRWYALALSRFLDENPVPLDLHPNTLLDNEQRFQDETALLNGEVYPEQLFEQLSSDFRKLLRGKSLLGLLLRQLAAKQRVARHNDKALMDMVGCNPGPLLNRIYTDIGALLGVSGAA